MKALLTGILATTAILACAPIAAADYLVPPDNSAATQYTEALPTSGGGKDTEGRDEGTDRSPGKVLGEKNAKALAQQGAEGREAASVAAETAPSSVATGDDFQDDARADADTGASGGGKASPPSGQGARDDDSSGPERVIGEASGVSSEDSGPLLLLVVIGSVAWAVGYLLWRRRRPTP